MPVRFFIHLCALLVGYIHAEICTDSVCNYYFDIRQHRTMQYRAEAGTVQNVAMENGILKTVPSSFWPGPDFIGLELNTSDVITADGFARYVITTNGQFPGPTIEVMQGSQVAVHVTNNLPTMPLTIHWHGISMKGTPWMDGAAYINQLPILPLHQFTYRFMALRAGTRWYHSHYQHQLGDGLFGTIIIHKNLPTTPEFVISVKDWYHVDSFKTIVDSPYVEDPLSRGPGNLYPVPLLKDFSHDDIELGVVKFVSALINGRGRYFNDQLPLTDFRVMSNEVYRFRIVHSGLEVAFLISIDSHTLQVVALDGNEVEPITVDYVIMQPGERIDVLVTANQDPKAYWVRAQTMRDGIGLAHEPDNVVQDVKAIMIYDNIIISDPLTSEKACSDNLKCLVFPCPFLYFPSSSGKYCIYMTDATSVQGFVGQDYGLDDSDYQELFLNTGFFLPASINGIEDSVSRMPFYAEDFDDYTIACDPVECNQENHTCRCTHIIDIPYGATIQLVLTNLRGDDNPIFQAHHPMHLHGHHFAVLAVGLSQNNQTTGRYISQNKELECANLLCRNAKWATGMPPLNLVNPPVKDEIALPAGGYAILRFKATNPGAWLLHCHVDLHFELGLSLVFREAYDRFPPVPQGLDEPGSFSWSEQDFKEYLLLAEQYENGNPPLEMESECIEGADFMLSTTTFAGYILAAVVCGIAVTIFVVAVISCRRKHEKSVNFS